MAKSIEVGSKVKFLGYSEEVADDQQFLAEGEEYTVCEVHPEEESLSVSIDNPDYNPKKKESDTNSKTIVIDVFNDEIEAVVVKGKPAAKGKSKPVVEAEEEEAEEEAPVAKAKPAKGKPAAKVDTKPAKGKTKEAAAAKGKPAKGKLKEKAEKVEKSEEELPTLEDEDEEILQLVSDSDDLIALADELVEEGAAIDYRLGGVLFHIRANKDYKDIKPEYAERGGFSLFVKEHLNIEYRKAMYLIDIYYSFNKFGIDGAKVAELGWTKCSKIAAVMTEDNAEDLVELAETSSVSELSDTIKESYVGGTKETEKRRKVTFKFRLWDDQAAAVEDILQAAASALGYKDLSDCFEHIVTEWAAEHDMGAAPQEEEEVKPAAKTKPKAKVSAKA